MCSLGSQQSPKMGSKSGSETCSETGSDQGSPMWQMHAKAGNSGAASSTEGTEGMDEEAMAIALQTISCIWNADETELCGSVHTNVSDVLAFLQELGLQDEVRLILPDITYKIWRSEHGDRRLTYSNESTLLPPGEYEHEER